MSTALTSHRKFLLCLFGLILLATGGIFLFSQTQIVKPTAFAAAKITLIPSESTLSVGEEAFFSIEVDTDGEAVNTVTANLSYPAETLELVNVSLQDSFAKIWFEKETNLPGEIHLTGSLPTPGFTGQRTFAKLTFRAKKEGEAKISFSSDSAVFRNLDSLNILGQTKSGLVNIR